MISETKYCDMKARIPEVKGLFQNRRYSQCATLCERLLHRSNGEIHPIHLAYLNFYLAMTHDTMARETSSRNRIPALDLAEKYYEAALAALSPARPQSLEDIQEAPSPTSSISEDEYSPKSRRPFDSMSINSGNSSSTTATSLLDEDSDCSDSEEPKISMADYSFPAPPSRHQSQKAARRRPEPISTAQSTHSRTPSKHEKQYSTVFSSFISMVESHLASVREFRDVPILPSNRFSGTRSRGSSLNTRPSSRDIMHDEAGMDKIRWERKSLGFRPRFDPQGVRQLCREALSEL
ncbi:hypothetical protein BCR34DRAFT_122563 [Clohesyomyces aquaticus]|uniref:Uncharacterized protein n=1 Tax=Clohesyomyces aquaticus TaxID=1231657 RepID=A0A1Y1YPJ4_9PLEO|nr:hypothetical protein BCR34DRAFT_122563 [Clohesyomyces aquaticus]